METPLDAFVVGLMIITTFISTVIVINVFLGNIKLRDLPSQT